MLAAVQEDAVEVGYAAAAGYDLIGEVEIALCSLHVLMAHEVHEAVYVHLAIMLILVYAVVGGEVVPELMAGELKWKDIGEPGDHELDGIAGQGISPAGDEEDVRAVWTGIKIRADEMLRQAAQRDSALLVTLATHHHAVIRKGYPAAAEGTDLRLPEAAVIHERYDAFVAEDKPIRLRSDGAEDKGHLRFRIDADLALRGLRHLYLLRIIGRAMLFLGPAEEYLHMPYIGSAGGLAQGPAQEHQEILLDIVLPDILEGPVRADSQDEGRDEALIVLDRLIGQARELPGEDEALEHIMERHTEASSS